MTKEELKTLVATKISGQGNQVDLGNALTTILNELIDTKPKRAPITIDLTGYDLGVDADVTSAIPTGYKPVIGDTIIYGGDSMILSGVSIIGRGFNAVFGFNAQMDWGQQVYLSERSGQYMARYYEI